MTQTTEQHRRLFEQQTRQRIAELERTLRYHEQSGASIRQMIEELQIDLADATRPRQLQQ